MIILIIIGAVAATLLGGFFALKFKDKLHLILGFSAGAVIGVAFFDLLPEALELSNGYYSVPFITSVVAIGFLIYLIADRWFLPHGHSHDHEHDEHCHKASHRGILGASSLALHSFLDGVAVGFAFHVSTAVGLIVALAVLAHDFSDGINTIGLIMKNGGGKRQAFHWLLIDAVAPVIGILFSFLFSVGQNTLAIILALFCGFFLYIGASDLLPESHHDHPTFLTTLMTVLGMAVIFVVIRLAGI